MKTYAPRPPAPVPLEVLAHAAACCLLLTPALVVGSLWPAPADPDLPSTLLIVLGLAALVLIRFNRMINTQDKHILTAAHTGHPPPRYVPVSRTAAVGLPAANLLFVLYPPPTEPGAYVAWLTVAAAAASCLYRFGASLLAPWLSCFGYGLIATRLETDDPARSPTIYILTNQPLEPGQTLHVWHFAVNHYVDQRVPFTRNRR